MSALFGFMGLLSLIIGFVMFVIALIRRRPKKQSGVIMLSGLVLFIVGVSLPSSEDIIEKGEEVTGVAASKDVGNNEDEDNKENEEENQENEEPVDEDEKESKSEFGINEKIEFEGRMLEVTNVERSSGDDFDKPKDGHEYVIVTVNIENSSDKEVSYNPFDFKMQNSNGQIESKAFTIIDNDTALSSGDLASGGNVSGTITFEQPIDDELQLIFEPSFWSSKRVTIDLN